MGLMSADLLIPGLLASPLPHAILGPGHDLRWANPAWQRLCLREATEGESWFDQVDEAALQIELPHITQLIAGNISSYTCASGLRTPEGPVGVMLHAVRINADITLVCAVPAPLPVALPSIAMVPASGRTPADDQVLASVMSHDFHQHLRLITSYISLIEQQEQMTLM